ncbi:hypothetical protein [Polycladidibacter hongkongensis]|uniref:hypothetical protein n=1 Tax=Polycladidibacter hongkongensis TaxID=1647556 RepID=UPI0008312827|nr:hypothetical protein [Pseudovibrio hongkongensis]
MPYTFPQNCLSAILFGIAALFCGHNVFAAETPAKSLFKQCPITQDVPSTFALCATAECWTLDNVAYCKCDVKNEQSISLPFHFKANGDDQDICDLLEAGLDNGFTVSTYATPRQLEADYDPAKESMGPPLAIYTCRNNDTAPAGYSAQCDGGLCFTSTQGKTFPGLGSIGANEIVCSCPAIPSPKTGFQIAGPWICAPGDKNVNGQCCDKVFHDKFCQVQSISRTGTKIYVGAPPGVGTILSKLLDGKAPTLNHCAFR